MGDITVVLGAVVVFSLPLTILIPNFSIWDVIPKVQVTRFHILSQHMTWPEINAVLVGLICIFFCLYLEIRKRKFDELVKTALTVNHVTDTTLNAEYERQAAAVKVCVKLLDTSTEHYESLALLHDELREKEKPWHQLPPVIEPSFLNI